MQRNMNGFRGSRLYFLMVAACCIACTSRAGSNAEPMSVGGASPPIDRLNIFVRDWPTYDVELTLVRDARGSTLTLFRQARDGRPRIVLDSIGPAPQDPEEISALLDTFDIWAMNAPDAPGAACRNRFGMRSCAITFKDYSLVMRVESGGKVRVQRYTGLEKSTANQSARGLADHILALARKREGRGSHP